MITFRNTELTLKILNNLRCQKGLQMFSSAVVPNHSQHSDYFRTNVYPWEGELKLYHIKINQPHTKKIPFYNFPELKIHIVLLIIRTVIVTTFQHQIFLEGHL